MKRRLLSAFLAVMMVLTMAPVAFAADEDAGNAVDDSASGSTGSAVAKIGDTGYATLAAAVAAANNGETVTLLTNTAEDITIAQDKNITLDLGSNTLTNNGGDTITVELGATLTITGNSEDENKVGTVDNVTNGKADIVNNGTVILNGGWYLRSEETGVDANTSGGNSYYNILNHGEMTINNDTVVMQEGKFSSLIVNGYYDYNGVKNKGERNQYIEGTNQAAPKLTINDGFFSGGINTIKNDDNAELVICDGVFGNVTQAVVQNNNVAEIHGGTFNATDHHAVENNHYEGNYNKGSVTITDGNFTGALYTTAGATWNITGGTFTADPSAYLAKDYKIEMVGSAYGVVPKSDAVAQNGEKTFVSLQNAINDAKDNDTITLLKDVDLGNTVTVANKTVTLNMAGKTIYNTKGLWDSKPNAWSLISVRENGNLTITGDGTLKAKADDCYALDTQEESAKLTVENGTVIGNISAIYASLGDVTINGGNYSIQQLNPNNVQDEYGLTINCYDQHYKDKTAKITVTGGYFVHFNPSDNKAEGAGTNFVADGYISVTSDKSGYDYMVTKKTDTGSITVKPAVAEPEVNVSDKISESDKAKVEDAAKSVEVPTLGAAAGDKVAAISKTDAESLVAKAQGLQNPTLYVQTALKVEPTAYNAENKTLALEITPQYRVVASTATTADEIKLDKNAQVVQDYQPMNITKATVVTMELPADFASGVDKLSIQHTKSNGTVEYYTGTVTEQNGKYLLTFTTNGFSPFVISVPAASIGENVYPTLQAAVDSVESGKTIKLEQAVAPDTKVTVAKTIKFEVATNEKTFAKENIVAGANTTVKVTGDASPYIYEFTYTKPSSGSSGGSSSGKTTYKVTTSAVNNGGVNASPSNAEKGATITITLSPDKGYKLDKLTVTDGSGKTVSTVKKSDTVYTFTMPASAVKVGVSYVKATETPSKTKFNDVSANDWFASAVDYVTGKGMMNGTADNTFSPKANTTRGMVVTVLYRLENQPSTSAASFTDVASGAYYANAVAWANANGIVSGYGSGKFGPNDKVTREQLAAILYRYAQYKKYDVSVGEDTNILSYDDAQSISSYAIPAIQWACGAGVVTGKSGSKLDPKGNATRAEVAAMLMRFCENVK